MTALKRLAPFALLLVAACVGGGGGMDGSPATPGDDDDDDASTSPTPTGTATAAPAYGGYVTVYRVRTDYAGGPNESASAMAAFYQPIEVDGDFELQPIDTCVTPQPAPTATATPEPVKSYDAGSTVTLSGASSISLHRKENQSFLYYAPSATTLPLDSVPHGGTWSVAWDGGADLAAGSIAGELRMPSSFSITSPAFPVTLSGAVNVTWTTSGAMPDDQVWLLVTTVASGGGASGSLTCRVADDGSFTIPGSAIATLPSGNGTLGGYRMRMREPLLPNGARMMSYGLSGHYGQATKP